MPKHEVRITGYGGQGIIMTGYIFGKAAAIYDDRHSTMTQSFGPEARGSACAASLILDDNVIAYPYLRKTDVLIALSREGYEIYLPEVNKQKGIIVYDEDMVKPEKTGKIKLCGVPAARIAEDLGRRIVQNIVVVGFATAATGIVSKKSAMESVKSSVPEATIDLNLQAFEKGYEYFKN